MSWHFSQALAEEYSAASCSGGEPCAQLSGSPTPLLFCASDRTMEFFRRSPCGMTFAPLTEGRGAELLTWFLAASRARTSALPGKGPDSTASAPASGGKWLGLLAKYDPASSSWRTPQCSLFEDSEPCLETWPRWGLMHGGECWELPPLAHPTDANESGLLPTLTLISCEHPGRFKLKEGQQTCISMELAKRDKWAVGGKYSPSHAAWFMAWPEWWTSLGHSAMDKYRLWRQRHGGF